LYVIDFQIRGSKVCSTSNEGKINHLRTLNVPVSCKVKRLELILKLVQPPSSGEHPMEGGNRNNHYKQD